MNIPQLVVDQADTVRRSGACNMMGSKDVQFHAFHMDLYQLCNWIDEHPGGWWELLIALGNRKETA